MCARENVCVCVRERGSVWGVVSGCVRECVGECVSVCVCACMFGIPSADKFGPIRLSCQHGRHPRCAETPATDC